MSYDPMIEQPKQLIVEGNDDARVFMSLCRYLGISDVQIWQCGGYQNLRGVLRTVVGLDDFDSVNSLAIVADANSSRNARIQSIQNALSHAGTADSIRSTGNSFRRPTERGVSGRSA